MNITSPKIKKLIELLNAGKQPVIEITQETMTDTIDYEKGMRCRCISYTDDSVDDTPDGLVLIVETTFTEFEKRNKAFSTPVWNSLESGKSGLCKWHESTWYPKDKQVALFLGNEDENSFKFVDDSETSVFDLYLAAKSELNYVEWLEHQYEKFVKGATIE